MIVNHEKMKELSETDFMNATDIELALRPILDEIEKRSVLVDPFVDKETYRIYLATLWSNLVLKPEEAGLLEEDLEAAHDIINIQAHQVLGEEEAITESFRFINSRPGEKAMEMAKLSKTHKELLAYFSSMILDPDGHKRWMDEVRKK